MRRATARALAHIGLAAARSLCLLALLLPPPLLAGVAPPGPPAPPPPAAAPGPAVRAVVERLESAFAAEAAISGLRPMGSAQTEVVATNADGSSVVAVTSAAGIPVPERSAPTFFWRRTTLVQVAATGVGEILSEGDLRVAYDAPRVTVTAADRFTAAIDRFARARTDLAGVEVRRTAGFDSPNLGELAALELEAGATSGSGSQRRQAGLRDRLEARNYDERVIIVGADGTERAYPASVDLRQLLTAGSGGGAELTIGCVSQCFEDNGGTLGVAGAICLVAGLVVCVGACAVSAGIACLPCIGGAGTVCGLVIAGGALGVCIARCINPSYSPPPPTPTQAVGIFTLSVQPLAAAVGHDVLARWTAPAGHGTTDWVGLYAEGAVNQNYRSFQYLSSATSGQLTFEAPPPPGRYELRLLLDDGYTEPSPARRAPLLVGSYSLTLAHAGVAPGSNFEVSWSAPPGHSDRDWIGLFTLGSASTDYLHYRYLSAATAGTVSFEAPATAGAYELRLLLRDGYSEPGPAVRRLITAGSCPIGDCDASGAVTVDEVMRMVALRLGRAGGEACGASAAEAGPSLPEIGAAASYAITGCGAGRVCGAERPCEAYLACDVRTTTCSAADTGTCEVRPPACNSSFEPVCGCDGVTYGNDCLRLAAEVPLKSLGACP